MSELGEENGRDSGFSDSESGGHERGLLQLSTPSGSPTPNLHDTASSLRLHLTLDFITKYQANDSDRSFLDGTLNYTRNTPPRYFSTPKSEAVITSSRKHRHEKWTGSVSMWLSEVRHWCDPECTSVLQNKPLISGDKASSVPARTSQVEYAIGSLHWQLRVVSEKLALLYKY